jgi:hypothetical protein
MPFPEQALVEIVECSRPAAGFFIAVAAQVGPIPEAFLPVVKLLLLAGVLGAATTMVAMEYFLFSFDDSSARKKAFWFCGILFPLPGPALYCFIVYSHSDVLKGNHRQTCRRRVGETLVGNTGIAATGIGKGSGLRFTRQHWKSLRGTAVL